MIDFFDLRYYKIMIENFCNVFEPLRERITEKKRSEPIHIGKEK